MSIFLCKQPSGYAGSNIGFSFVAKQLLSCYNINMFRRIDDKINERSCVSMNSIFNKKNKEENTTYDTMSSLSHTKWNCKYHIVFTPKYRRKIFYGQKRLEIGKILREISDWQGVKIIEAEVCQDHVHMFVEIPPKLSVSKYMGILKGKSSLIIFQRWSNLKYKFGQRSFWCRGYFVDTAGKNAKIIAAYVRNQLQEDMMYDQISIKEYKDPFNGS